ncbi:MAG: hypothetical protein AAGC82_17245, partial [Pseudomonadota bacterium]
RKTRTGGVKAAPQGRPRRRKLDAVSDRLRARVEAEPDITMPELAAALKVAHDIGATPAMRSRHLIHRLGFTYKKIADQAKPSQARALSSRSGPVRRSRVSGDRGKEPSPLWGR